MTLDRFIESIKEDLLKLPAIKFAAEITSFEGIGPDETEWINYRRRIIVNAIVRPYAKHFMSTVDPYSMSVKEYDALFLKNIDKWLLDSSSSQVI